MIVADRGELFAVIHERPLSAYDAEQVAWAGRQGCSLQSTTNASLYGQSQPFQRFFNPNDRDAVEAPKN
jgi:hypothetical protein